jgi:hypothetical protein
MVALGIVAGFMGVSTAFMIYAASVVIRDRNASRYSKITGVLLCVILAMLTIIMIYLSIPSQD